MAPLLLLLELQCIILSPIPEGKRREPKLGDISTIKLPKLYIKMKQIINAKPFLVSVRSGLGLESQVGTKFLQKVVVKFHSHVVKRKIKAGLSNFPR